MEPKVRFVKTFFLLSVSRLLVEQKQFRLQIRTLSFPLCSHDIYWCGGGGTAPVPALQPPDAGRLCQRPLRGAARGLPLHLRGLRVHGPGPPHRALPHLQARDPSRGILFRLVKCMWNTVSSDLKSIFKGKMSRKCKYKSCLFIQNIFLYFKVYSW